MKCIKWLFIVPVVFCLLQGVAWGQEAQRAKPYQIQNRLRVEYDDNIYQETQDENDSWKIIEEVILQLNLRGDQSALNLRYRPSYVYWFDREPDKSDLNHDLDVVLNHKFTPRLSLSMVDTLRRGELPELVDGNILVREKDDFWYNTFNATLGIGVRPSSRLDVAGRYVLLRYDDDTTADTEDFDLFVGGLTWRQQWLPDTTILLELRGEEIEYEGPDRGSQSLFAGVGIEQMFAPKVVASARGGYQRKEFNKSELGSEESPYGDVALTLLASPTLRITAGAGHSLFETDVYPFANQERSQIFGSVAYDVTAKVALYLTGSYTMGDYDASQAVEQNLVKSGDEEYVQASARATYKINRSNWIEAGWQFVDLDSGLETVAGDKYRASFQRNRFDLGWKTQF